MNEFFRNTALRAALKQAATLSFFCFMLFFFPPVAKAGLWDNLKQFSELPSEVNELKQNYRQTLDNYNETLTKLDQANESIRSYREENEKLIEQNETLASMVLELQQAEQTREENARKVRSFLFAAIGVLAGYFMLLRAIRFAMRVRTRQHG